MIPVCGQFLKSIVFLTFCQCLDGSGNRKNSETPPIMRRRSAFPFRSCNFKPSLRSPPPVLHYVPHNDQTLAFLFRNLDCKNESKFSTWNSFFGKGLTMVVCAFGGLRLWRFTPLEVYTFCAFRNWIFERFWPKYTLVCCSSALRQLRMPIYKDF